MELGVSIGGEGYLPSILGDFHATWMANNRTSTSEDRPVLLPRATTSCSRSAPRRLVLGRLSGCRHLHPLPEPHRQVIQDVTDPIMPVINALTTPIPACRPHGRDCSVIDLASDMSALFGGVSRVDFIIAMVRLLEVIDGLPPAPRGC